MTTTVRFDGKTVLVTGAGKGIGWGIAKKLAECGAKVYALSRTQADLDRLHAEAPNIHPVCVELADWDATRKAVEDLGPIHMLVNNASIAVLEPFIDTTRDSMERSFAINVHATVNVSQVGFSKELNAIKRKLPAFSFVSQVVARGMIERGEGGSIVIISSIASDVALTNSTAYCGTKGAQDSVMHVMAKELGPHKIRVNSIHPTVVMTPMGRKYWAESPLREPFLARHPMGQFAEIEDIVDGTLFLLSDQSAMISGTCLTIDGGLTAN